MNFNFTTINFALVFTVAVILYYAIPVKMHKVYLIILNLLFALSFSVSTLAFLLAVSLLTYIAGRVFDNLPFKRAILFFHIILVVVILGLLRSTFYNDTYSLVVPVGISFYGLQAISYVVDLYKGKEKVTASFLDMLSYLTFFPTFSSGPIIRYSAYKEELEYNMHASRASFDRIVNGLIYMLYGYFLKFMIAERTVTIVDEIVNNYDDYYSLALIVGAVCYSFQLYADFAGYSAIVIGAAQVLGFDLSDNFKAPYLSISIKEFWSRWHVSLSSWLKDYIYIPLGGNRKGKLRKAINLMLTFIISGIWHGTGIHYIMWSGIHGIYNICEDICKKSIDKITESATKKHLTILWNTMRRVLIFALVTIAWIPFRISNSCTDSVRYLFRILTYPSIHLQRNLLFERGISGFELNILIISLQIMFIVDLIYYKTKMHLGEYLDTKPIIVKSFVTGFLLLFVMIYGIWGDVGNATSFVYTGF